MPRGPAPLTSFTAADGPDTRITYTMGTLSPDLARTQALVSRSLETLIMRM